MISIVNFNLIFRGRLRTSELISALGCIKMTICLFLLSINLKSLINCLINLSRCSILTDLDHILFTRFLHVHLNRHWLSELLWLFLSETLSSSKWSIEFWGAAIKCAVVWLLFLIITTLGINVDECLLNYIRILYYFLI